MPDKQQPILQQTIRVFGHAELPAYERTVAMREVVFTCVVCQKQSTQLRYPGPLPRYCSEECRAAQAQILNQERVRKQREKRQAMRAARKKTPNTARFPYADRFSDSDQHTTLSLLPMLASRLSPPRLPALLVERSRLLTLLDAGREQKLTLLQAPAGFGKTTLVTQWIAHRQEQRAITQQNPLLVAWLSLDSGDNDPVRFWSSMITACQTFHASIGQTTLAHLSQTPRLSFASAPLETALTFLLNDLTHFVQEGLLILEDYHLIEHPRIHETLAFFLEHLPTSLHVVMLTRSEPQLPLVRWRARGDLLEVYSAQLRFSAQETALFLQQIIPSSKGRQQTLSEEAVRLLHTQLEGWAAGLRLLALSLQGQMASQAVEDYLAQTSTGSGSATSPSHRSIQEYFMSEVFSTLPTWVMAGAGLTPARGAYRAGVNPAPAITHVEELQLFLLQTSILSRLTGSLCNAVTGRQDCAQWLERAERSGFFLEALDSTGQWYRYHALFAETMRAEATRRLGEEELRHLSLKASRWYEEHSMTVEAIEAALHAQESEHAACLIEGLHESTYFSEQHTLLRWLKQLPEPLLQAHPALCFRYALALYISEDVDITQLRTEEIEALLQMAEEGWRKLENMPDVGILYAFRTTLAVIQGRDASAVAYAKQALQYLPLPTEPGSDQMQKQPSEWVDWRCGCLVALGQDAMRSGCFEQARQFILEAHTLSWTNIDRTFTRTTRRMLGEISFELGELHQAREYYQQTLANTEEELDRGEDVVHALSICGLAQLCYEWNQLEMAEQLAGEAANYNYTGYLLHWEEEGRTSGELLRLRVLHARGEVVLAQQQLSALFARLQASSIPNIGHLIPDVLAWQARLQMSDGDLFAARRTLNILTSHEKELYPLQLETLRLLRARLLLARGEAAAALHSLGQLLITALEGKHLIRALEIQLLIALAHAADGQEQKARQWLYEVLSQARTEGFLRLFLDEGEPLATLLRSLLPTLTEKPLRSYARSILHAFADPHSIGKNSTASPLLEPLSAQEQRVLTLLIAGRSNPEIAQELIVSVNTVKGHVKNLYRKLNVNNRVQAGEIARQLKLV